MGKIFPLQAIDLIRRIVVWHVGFEEGACKFAFLDPEPLLPSILYITTLIIYLHITHMSTLIVIIPFGTICIYMLKPKEEQWGQSLMALKKTGNFPIASEQSAGSTL